VVTHRRDAHTAATALSPTDFKAESAIRVRAKYAYQRDFREKRSFSIVATCLSVVSLLHARYDEQKHLVTSRRRIAPRTPPARRPRRSF
jgi:hypothetical protein